MKNKRKNKEGRSKMAKEKETKNVIGEVVTDVKEKAEAVVGEVKETTEKVVTEVKETATSTVEKAKNVIETTKGKTWWNRIWSAIVGALIAVGSMFGITTEQIAEQKQKTEEVKTLAIEALDAIKKGDVATAKAALELAAETGKQVIDESKKVIDNIKNANREDIKNTAHEAIKTELQKSVTSEKK